MMVNQAAQQLVSIGGKKSLVITCHKLLLGPCNTHKAVYTRYKPLTYAVKLTGAQFIRLGKAIRPSECTRGSLAFW